jgi:hypothetical protein
VDPLEDSPLEDSVFVDGEVEVVEDWVPVEVPDDCEPVDVLLEVVVEEVVPFLAESAGSCPEASWT